MLRRVHGRLLHNHQAQKNTYAACWRSCICAYYCTWELCESVQCCWTCPMPCPRAWHWCLPAPLQPKPWPRATTLPYLNPALPKYAPTHLFHTPWLNLICGMCLFHVTCAATSAPWDGHGWWAELLFTGAPLLWLQSHPHHLPGSSSPTA